MYRLPAEMPRARLPLLDQVTIVTPCRESWDAMTGDDRVRFCARCSKNVHDLSAMTRDEAETFLETHLDADDACVRLYRRPDGRVLTSECVQGARNRHARRVAVGVAAGLCAAFAGTLALASVHVPDGRNLPKVRARIDVKRVAAGAADVIIPADEVPSALSGDAAEDFGYYGLGGPGIPSRPTVVENDMRIEGGLPPDVVRRVVRLRFGLVRLCHDSALRNDSAVTGSVRVHFVIGPDGSVISAQDVGSDLPDPTTVVCAVGIFKNLSFPQPSGAAPVSVSYRFTLKPGP
jgi:hypothetical protein